MPVKTNTALDRDARKRATSVYLVQRAVPMLPPQLSEQLCSLQPGEERLAFSAFFTIDKDGNVISTDFARTIIKWVKCALSAISPADPQVMCQAVVRRCWSCRRWRIAARQQGRGTFACGRRVGHQGSRREWRRRILQTPADSRTSRPRSRRSESRAAR